MDWFANPSLTALIFLPAAGAVALSLLPRAAAPLHRWGALTVALAGFLYSLCVLIAFDPSLPGYQFTLRREWVPSLGVSYFLGMDGISLWLVLLTTFLSPLVILGSFQAVTAHTRRYYALLLLLQTGMLGAFLALDTFLFYVFWEFMLIPLYFLVGIWGGQDRIYAAMKLFLFTMAGSVLMLVAIFSLAWMHASQSGTLTLALPELLSTQIPGGGWLSPQSLLFLAFLLAFAVKVPLFPLHTWLPDAHVQAPTAGSVILAGVLLKMGGYGLIRFAIPLFPEAARLYQTPLMALSAVAIVYGACLAWAQTDIKKLVAYSSVSHMGYVVLGLFSLDTLSATGAVFQMLCHGISTGGLFLLVGMLYERRHTRDVAQYGGLARTVPLLTVAFLILTLSSVALPGTNGFVGEFLILLGSFGVSPSLTAIAGLGVILGAVYLFWLFQKVFLGPVTVKENEGLADLSLREVAVLAPLITAVFAMGWMPNPILKKIEPAVRVALQGTLPQGTPETPTTEGAE